MAGLSLGRPLVTNVGELSEPYWATCGAVIATPIADAGALAAAVIRLLDDPTEQMRMGSAAAEYYRENFSAERVIAALRREEAT